ncbi:MAG: hypothetical protein ACLRWQ_17735 [Flavonifractor plautii]
MSITAYKIEAVGHDRIGKDFGYVNIMYRYGNKQVLPPAGSVRKAGGHVGGRERLRAARSWQQRWATLYMTWLMGSWDCGVFTHRDCPAADGYLHRSEAQGTGVVWRTPEKRR